MFWGPICADGRRELVCCEGSMNSVQYCSILQRRYLTRYIKKMLQQDNASSHCSSYTKKFMIDNKIDLLPNYPPCSPDLDIIENMWSILTCPKKFRRTSNNCWGRIHWNFRFRHRKFVLQHSQSYFRCPSLETLLICNKSILEPHCIHKFFYVHIKYMCSLLSVLFSL